MGSIFCEGRSGSGDPIGPVASLLSLQQKRHWGRRGGEAPASRHIFLHFPSLRGECLHHAELQKDWRIGKANAAETNLTVRKAK